MSIGQNFLMKFFNTSDFDKFTHQIPEKLEPPEDFYNELCVSEL